MTKLVDHASLLLAFVKFALLERVVHGDLFLSFAKEIQPYVSLTSIFARIPLPTTINRIDSAFQATAYKSATFFKKSKFDSVSLNKTAAEYIDYALSIPQISASSWFIALIYVDRFICKCPSTILSTTNFYKLFSTALMVAIKYHEERDIPLATFADLAFCTKEEIIELEKCFLEILDYRMYISDEDLEMAEIGLVSFALFSKDGEDAGNSLQAHQINTLSEGLRLKNLWTLHKLMPPFANHVPHHSPFALIHGDGWDMWRLTQSYSSLAGVQIEMEFGPLTSNIDLLFSYKQFLTMEAQQRLGTLMSVMQGTLPLSELGETSSRCFKSKTNAHSVVDGHVRGVTPADIQSPWSVSTMSEVAWENEEQEILHRLVVTDENLLFHGTRISQFVGTELEREIFGSDDERPLARKLSAMAENATSSIPQIAS